MRILSRNALPSAAWPFALAVAAALAMFLWASWTLTRLAQEVGDAETVVRSNVRAYWQLNIQLQGARASCRKGVDTGSALEFENCLNAIDSARSGVSGDVFRAEWSRRNTGMTLGELEIIAVVASRVVESAQGGRASEATDALEELDTRISAFLAPLMRVESEVMMEQANSYETLNTKARMTVWALSASVGLAFALFLMTMGFLHWRKLLQARLEKAKTSASEREKIIHSTKEQTELGILAAGVAHEINNPLTAILGFAQMLRMSLPQAAPHDARIVEYARRIERQAEKIAVITQNLCLMRTTGTRPGVEWRDVRESAVLAADLVEERFRALHGVLVRELTDEPCLFACVESELFHVIHSLLSNAVEAALGREHDTHGGTPPTVWLRVRRGRAPSHGVRVEVEDNGIGIPHEIQEKIFVPFFTTKNVGSGSCGLGLPVAGSLVSRLGGTIYLDRTRRNTCFVVEFPGQDTGSPETPAARGEGG